MKIVKKNVDLKTFIEIAKAFMQTDAKSTKAAQVIMKQSKIISESLNSYEDKIEMGRIDNCSVDEKGNIIRTPEGGFVYTKEGLKALNKLNSQLLEEVIEFELVLSKEHIQDCKESYKDYFEDFLTTEK